MHSINYKNIVRDCIHIYIYIYIYASLSLQWNTIHKHNQ